MFDLSRQGAVDVITGTDPLNVEFVDAVRGIVGRCVQTGQPRIVFDMRNIPFIDSAGLELLLESRDQCLQRGGVMHLAGANALCGDILHITGVEAQFEVFDDVMPAVGSFAL